MANIYYEQKLPNGAIQLTSIWDTCSGIAIAIANAESYSYIALTEEDQDKLIAGILERRGIHPANSIPYIQNMKKTMGGVTSEGSEQSLICPYKTY